MNKTISLLFISIALSSVGCDAESSARTAQVFEFETDRAAIDVVVTGDQFEAIAVSKDNPSIEVVEQFERADLERLAEVEDAGAARRLEGATMYAVGSTMASLEDADEFRVEECAYSDLGSGCLYSSCVESSRWCVQCSAGGEWWGYCEHW